MHCHAGIGAAGSAQEQGAAGWGVNGYCWGCCTLQVSAGRHALCPHLQAFFSLIWMQKDICGSRYSVWGSGLIMMVLAPSVSHLFFFFNVGWSCFHLECVYIVTNRKNTMRTGQSYLDRQVPRWQGPSLMGLLHCLLWCIWCLRLFASREYRSSAQKRQNCVYFSRDWSDWCLEVSKVKWEANG